LPGLEIADDLRIGQGDGIIHLGAGDEALELFGAQFIHREAEDFEPLALVVLEGFDEVRNLGAAGGAPGRPEIHEQDLSLVVGQPDGVPLKVFHEEIRGGNIHALGVEDGGAGCEYECCGDQHGQGILHAYLLEAYKPVCIPY